MCGLKDQQVPNQEGVLQPKIQDDDVQTFGVCVCMCTSTASCAQASETGLYIDGNQKVAPETGL